MKDGSKDITTHKALLVFHSRVLPLGDVKEEQGGTQHLLSFLIFFVATLSSEGRRVFFFFFHHTVTHIHTYPQFPTTLFTVLLYIGTTWSPSSTPICTSAKDQWLTKFLNCCEKYFVWKFSL